MSYSPCKTGHYTINCSSCEKGTRKLSMFEPGCQICESEDTIKKKIFEDFNQCNNYKCLPARVQMSQKINPYCLTSYELFSSILINYYVPMLYTLLILAFIMSLATANRKFGFFTKLLGHKKKKLWRDTTEHYDRAFLVFTFQGDNLPENQWFLEMDLSKDFLGSMMPRQDYLNLTRVEDCLM